MAEPILNPDDYELLIVHHEDDSPEARAAAEKALLAAGVVTPIRHMTAFDVINELTPLRSDGYAPRARNLNSERPRP